MDSRFSMKSPTRLDQELVRRSASPRELSQNLAWNRREFLRTAAGVTLGASISPAGSVFRASAFPKDKKVVVITFGGGARDQETFAPEGQENIPHLMREMIPQARFFTKGFWGITWRPRVWPLECMKRLTILPPHRRNRQPFLNISGKI